MADFRNQKTYFPRPTRLPFFVRFDTENRGAKRSDKFMSAIYEASLPFITEPIAIADTFATSLTIERCYSNLRITHYCDRQTSANNPILERVIVARIVIPISECKHACTQLYDALLHSGLLTN